MITIQHYNDFINNLSHYFLNTHLSSNSLISEKFVSFTSNSIAVDAFASYLEKLDCLFFNSKQRKLSYNVKHIRKRCIETSFGTVTFNRRIYQHKSNLDYFYYIDDVVLNINLYQRISNELIADIFNDVTSDSYQRIVNKFSLSKSTIYNLICRYNYLVLDLSSNISNHVDTLYVQADECYISLQKNKVGAKSNKVMIHHVCIHEGLENISKGRNKLVNKLLFTKAYDEKIDEFYSRIHNTIDSLYSYNHLYFYGDGAYWIKSCAQELAGTFILDLFHSYQAISRICNANKEHIDILIKLCNQNLYDDFFDYIHNNLEYEKFNEYRKNNYKYLLNNWKYIQRNYTLKDSVGCSQEGINFHHFASRLTTNPKGFNEANARFIAQLICMKNNSKNSFRINLTKLIKETITKTKYDNKCNSKTQRNDYVLKQGKVSHPDIKKMLKESKSNLCKLN